MPRILETVSLFALIAVAILRPLVAESYDSAGSPFTEALQAVSDPSPLRTLVFDLLILAAALGWLVARALGPSRPYRRTGLEWGAGLIVIAAVVSCCVAGNKRLAINASIDWLCYPLLAITLVQLMRRPWHKRLLVTAVLASACVQAVHCMEQYFVGFDETWAHYESIKDQFWASQDVDLDSTRVESFERRIHSREATGFLPHSNVTGSYLVLCGIAALGLAVTRWRRPKTLENRLTAIAVTLGMLLILAAIGLTKSLGAVIAGLVGIALWLLLVLGRSWIDAHRTKAVLIGWVCAAAGAFGVIGHGLYRNSLPSWSLTFRWQWWRASSELIADYALTGVGRENFGRHYLRHKLIESPEEVANPHNLFVQAASDWGVLGLIGIVTMLVGASLAIGRPTTTAESFANPRTGSPGKYATLLWMAGFILVVTLGRLPLLGTNDPNFLYYGTVTAGLFWVLGFAVFGLGWSQAGSRTDSSTRTISTGVAIGLFSFILHDMINFASFVPGAATTLFALFAFVIATRAADKPANQPQTVAARWLPLAAFAAGIIVILWMAAVPVAQANKHLQLARRTGTSLAPAPITAQLAHHYFVRAIEADPLDPTPCVEHARWVVAASTLPELGKEALRLAEDSLTQAIERDPFSIQLRRMQAQLYRTRADATGSPEDRVAAVEAARKALGLYPHSPSDIAALADCQLEAGQTGHSEELLQQAIENYERALKLDEARLWWEELRRFRRKDREAIREKIDRAQALLQKGP
ncbi:MAG: O-antigen ligase family protein [Phycisphaerales bacterium]|nr:MAG: O-antigen ligase family protein [Phycisphaerales bacterium]